MHIRDDPNWQPPFCVSAEILFNKTSVGVFINSSALCPYLKGPCSYRNGSDGTSVHTREDLDWQPPFCVSAEIMFNRTSVGVLFNSSAPCPYPEGPCSCRNGSDGTSLHTCKPWGSQRFPFGSEFAFDTTGQEEVYVWARQEPVLHLVRPERSCALLCLWHSCVPQRTLEASSIQKCSGYPAQ